MRTVAVLTNEIDTRSKQLDGLIGTAEAFRADPAKATELAATLTTIKTLNTDLEALDVEMLEAQQFETLAATNTKRMQAVNTPVNRPEMPNAATLAAGNPLEKTAADVPVEILSRVRTEQLHNFTGTREERARKAYGFGMWFLATQFGNTNGLKYCAANGFETRAQLEGTNSTGGYLVPEVLDSDIIILREKYGVFRQYAKVTGMTSDTKMVPRRVGGLTAYWPGEAGAITASTATWDRVRLVAKKPAVLTLYSSEINEDAIIEMANDLAGEIAYAFSKLEDQCGFIGDGTSTYGGIVGLSKKFLDLSATRANIAGLHVGAGNAFSELVLGDFNATKALLPQYANTMGSPKWYASQAFYSGVMEKLMMAAGGVTMAEIAMGRDTPKFMGHDVVISQVLPQVEANDTIVCYYGCLELSSLFGDRRQTTIALSNEYAYANDELAIRGTERFDINNHDVGNQSATASLREAGPIVGLLMAAS